MKHVLKPCLREENELSFRFSYTQHCDVPPLDFEDEIGRTEIGWESSKKCSVLQNPEVLCSKKMVSSFLERARDLLRVCT